MDNNNRIDYDPIKSEADKVSVKQAVGSFVNFLKNLFSIYDGVDRQKTVEDIRSDIEFSAINIWILICSILVASIGLINNSPAVIIGAMLISPLMGPIRGIGYALSANDFKGSFKGGLYLIGWPFLKNSAKALTEYSRPDPMLNAL